METEENEEKPSNAMASAFQSMLKKKVVKHLEEDRKPIGIQMMYDFGELKSVKD